MSSIKKVLNEDRVEFYEIFTYINPTLYKDIIKDYKEDNIFCYFDFSSLIMTKDITDKDTLNLINEINNEALDLYFNQVYNIDCMINMLPDETKSKVTLIINKYKAIVIKYLSLCSYRAQKPISRTEVLNYISKNLSNEYKLTYNQLDELVKNNHAYVLDSELYVRNYLPIIYSKMDKLLLYASKRIGTNKIKTSIVLDNNFIFSENIIEYIPLISLFLNKPQIFIFHKDTLSLLLFGVKMKNRFLIWYTIRYFAIIASKEKIDKETVLRHVKESFFFNLIEVKSKNDKQEKLEIFENIFSFLNFYVSSYVADEYNKNFADIIEEALQYDNLENIQSLPKLNFNNKYITDYLSYPSDIIKMASYKPPLFHLIFNKLCKKIIVECLDYAHIFLYNRLNITQAGSIFQLIVEHMRQTYLSMLKDEEGKPIVYDLNHIYILNDDFKHGQLMQYIRQKVKKEIDSLNINYRGTGLNVLIYCKSFDENLSYRFETLLEEYPLINITMMIPADAKIKLDSTHLYSHNFNLIVYNSEDYNSLHITGDFHYDKLENSILYFKQSDIVCAHSINMNQLTITSSKLPFEITLYDYTINKKYLGINLFGYKYKNEDIKVSNGSGEYTVSVQMTSEPSNLVENLDGLPYYVKISSTEEVYKGTIQSTSGIAKCEFAVDMDFSDSKSRNLYFSFFKSIGLKDVKTLEDCSHDTCSLSEATSKDKKKIVTIKINKGDIPINTIFGIKCNNIDIVKDRLLYSVESDLELEALLIDMDNESDKIKWGYKILSFKEYYAQSNTTKEVEVKELSGKTGNKVTINISQDIEDKEILLQGLYMLVIFAYIDKAYFMKKSDIEMHISFPFYPALMFHYKSSGLYLYKYGRLYNVGEYPYLPVLSKLPENMSDEEAASKSPYIINKDNINISNTIDFKDNSNNHIIFSASYTYTTQDKYCNIVKDMISSTHAVNIPLVYENKYPKITKEMLLQVFDNVQGAKKHRILDEIVAELNRVYNGKPMYVHYKLNTRLRLEHFFAQCAVEANNLRTKEDFTYKADNLMYIDKYNQYATLTNFGNIKNVIKSNNLDYKKEWYDFISTHAYGRGIQKNDITDEHRKALANRLYSNKVGNGDVESGDGWRYIGRGIKQLTGKENYLKLQSYINDHMELFGVTKKIYIVDTDKEKFDSNRELLEHNGKYALLSGAYFWLSYFYKNNGEYSDKIFKGMQLYEIADSSKNNTETVKVMVTEKVGKETKQVAKEIDKYVLAISLVVNGGTNGIEKRNENFKKIRKQGIFKEFDNY